MTTFMQTVLFIIMTLIGIALIFMISMFSIEMLTDYIKERRNDKRRQNSSNE